MKERITAWILPMVITFLAVADGLLHLRLISLLFGGKYWGTPSFGPPPGAAAPATAGTVASGPPTGGGSPPHALPFISLPNNELFLLNCIGFILLAAVLWITLWRFSRAVWVIDVALMVFSAASILGWVRVGKPNPMGYGYWSKGFEVALIVALLMHLGSVFARRRVAPAQSRRNELAV